ncbi:MAG: sulfite exporter TauE/SafE family protein, partial [Rhodospirillales bacterium]|nr:sulfite exporter TauE/SafE family protein [Rhodospirillales bacterium]
VLLTGISKSGFSGGVGSITVAIMAVFVSPLKAAAIMLPILVLMDWLGLWAYRKTWDKSNLLIMLPAAVVGIGIGTMTFRYVDENTVRLLLGVITLAFALSFFIKTGAAGVPVKRHWLLGALAGGISGFTSFVAHAGGPPVKFYLLPQQMDKTLFVGTNVMFFFAINQMKLVPYAWLGQFSAENLIISAVLLPLAPFGIWLGLKLHGIVSQSLFYWISYSMMIVAGGKLLFDGLTKGGYL